MSFNSPAKQERIERHLMRQRGAGVRTVSANFGFAFGSSAPSSSDATATYDEPPAKRRKTLFSKAPIVSEEAKPETKTTKTVKARRRLMLEDEDNRSVRSRKVVADDSFVFGLEAKRKTTKKAKATDDHGTEISVEAVIQKQTARGRPKKPAAPKAAVKATHIVGGTPSVVQEQHDAIPKKASRARKKDLLALESVEAANDHGAAHEAISHVKSARPRNTQPQKKRKAENVVHEEQNLAEPELSMEPSVHKRSKKTFVDGFVSDVTSTIPAKRPRKKKPLTATCEDHDELCLTTEDNAASKGTMSKRRRPRKRSNAVDEIHQAHPVAVGPQSRESPYEKHSEKSPARNPVAQVKAATVLKSSRSRGLQKLAIESRAVDDPAETDEMQHKRRHEPAVPSGVNSKVDPAVKSKASGKKEAPRVPTEESLSNLEVAHVKRQPLKETNVNHTIRSSSPEKHLSEGRAKASERTKFATGEEQFGRTDQMTGNRLQKPATNERRKLHVHRHVGTEQDFNDEPSEPLPEITDLTRHAGGVEVATGIDHAMSSDLVPKHATVNVERESLSRNLEDPARAVAKKATTDPAPTRKPNRKRSTGEMNTSKRRERLETKREDQAAVGSESPAQDEDVDWLFAPQESVRAVKVASKRQPLTAKVRKGRRDVSDSIDLDDLLSNIASFATENAKAKAVAIGRDATGLFGEQTTAKKSSKPRKRL